MKFVQLSTFRYIPSRARKIKNRALGEFFCVTYFLLYINHLQCFQFCRKFDACALRGGLPQT